jgi:hypothetical protein
VQLRHQEIAIKVLIQALFNALGARQIRQRLITFFFKLDRVADFNNIARVNHLWNHIRLKCFAARSTLGRASL